MVKLIALTGSTFNLFRQYIYDNIGINIEENKSYLIETRLSKLLIDLNINSFEELYNLLVKNRDLDIKSRVVDAITTNETFWFRDEKPWIIIGEKWLQNVVSEFRKGKRTKVRIWSAAASTGQEIYSTVMYIDDYLFKNRINDIKLDLFEFIATDISIGALEIAKKGLYDSLSINRGLNSEFREKYFEKEGVYWKVKGFIRSHVKFDYFNLKNSFMYLGKYDLVFCRYVLIYFSDQLKQEIFVKLKSVMERESILFLGTSEVYYEINKYFNKIYFYDSTCYMLKKDG